MARVKMFWLQWGTLSSLLALLFAQDSMWDCSDKDDVLKEIPADVITPSACTLHCTVLTYRKVFQMQEKLTVYFKDSQTGELNDYCWSTKINCRPGQHMQSAFILLPLDLTVADGKTLRLQISSSTDAPILQQHAENSLLSPKCGTRFDVMEQMTAKERQSTLCVRIIAQKQITLRRGLKCPPFLVTTWKQWNQG